MYYEKIDISPLLGKYSKKRILEYLIREWTDYYQINQDIIPLLMEIHKAHYQLRRTIELAIKGVIDLDI